MRATSGTTGQNAAEDLQSLGKRPRSARKVEVFVEALKRVTLALRKLRAPSQAELARKALAAPREVGRVSKATEVAQARRGK